MKKNKFKRQGLAGHKRINRKWRRPRGVDSKMRKEKKGHPPLVKVGYRKPKSERGLHPSGFQEVLVNNSQEVEEVDSDTQAIRIASSVGGRKRETITEKADDQGIKILNAKRRERIESRDAEETGS